MIFKLERERPVYTTIKDNLYYVRDKYLRKYNLTAGVDAPVALMRRTSTAPLYSLSYNLQEGALLLTSGVCQANFFLHTLENPLINNFRLENRQIMNYSKFQRVPLGRLKFARKLEKEKESLQYLQA